MCIYIYMHIFDRRYHMDPYGHNTLNSQILDFDVSNSGKNSWNMNETAGNNSQNPAGHEIDRQNYSSGIYYFTWARTRKDFHKQRNTWIVYDGKSIDTWMIWGVPLFQKTSTYPLEIKLGNGKCAIEISDFPMKSGWCCGT